MPTSQGDVAAEALGVVHAPILQSFPELVAELGGDPAVLLGQVGIDMASAMECRPSVNYRQMADLLELAAAQLDCPDFGLRLASRQCNGGIAGPVGEAMRHSQTFGEALDVVARHGYAHSLAAGVWLERSRSGRSTLLGYDILLDRLPAKCQVVEQIMLIGHLSALKLTSGMVGARRIHFRHQPVSAMRTYRRHFGCEVRFGQQANATLYYDRDLAKPIVAADPEAFRSAISFIEAQFPHRQPPLKVLVRGMIMHFLGTDLCTVDWIGEKLALHPRTLHRRMHEEGTSFRKIGDEVRRDMAFYYLRETGLSFTEISEHLGFSEQAVLTRCCQRWFSRSPTQVRGGNRRTPAIKVTPVRSDQAERTRSL